MTRLAASRPSALMASAPHDYGFSPQETYTTAVPSWRKASTVGTMPAKDEKHSVDIGQFTKIPNRLFSSGTARDLKPSATLLYVALCDHANRNGSNHSRLPTRHSHLDTTLSPRTICDARKKLDRKETDCRHARKGPSYFYTLTVQKLDRVPLPKRPRLKLQPRAYHARKTIAEQTGIVASATVAETAHANFAGLGAANFAGHPRNVCWTPGANFADPSGSSRKVIIERCLVHGSSPDAALSDGYFALTTNPAPTHPIARITPHGMRNPATGKSTTKRYSHAAGAGVG